MTDPQRVIDESLPMLTEFLTDVGLHAQSDEPIDYPSVLPVFSDWIRQQDIAEDDRFYLASRIGAFICEYLIDTSGARRYVKDERILLCVPMIDDVEREMDPYPLALGVADKKVTLQDVIQSIPQ